MQLKIQRKTLLAVVLTTTAIVILLYVVLFLVAPTPVIHLEKSLIKGLNCTRTGWDYFKCDKFWFTQEVALNTT